MHVVPLNVLSPGMCIRCTARIRKPRSQLGPTQIFISPQLYSKYPSSCLNLLHSRLSKYQNSDMEYYSRIASRRKVRSFLENESLAKFGKEIYQRALAAVKMRNNDPNKNHGSNSREAFTTDFTCSVIMGILNRLRGIGSYLRL